MEGEPFQFAQLGRFGQAGAKQRFGRGRAGQGGALFPLPAGAFEREKFVDPAIDTRFVSLARKDEMPRFFEAAALALQFLASFSVERRPEMFLGRRSGSQHGTLQAMDDAQLAASGGGNAL